MGEVLRGGPENPEVRAGTSAPQESTSGVLVRVGEDFEPFRTLTTLPKYDPKQGIEQNMFSVGIELDGIPGTLTLFPDVDENSRDVPNPTLSVEATFQVKSLDEFKKLDSLRLRLDANRNIRYLDLRAAESETAVQRELDLKPAVDMSASRLHTRTKRQARNFVPRPKSLRKIRARFIAA